jgi:deoxyribodipyrimidine photolyase-related protein
MKDITLIYPNQLFKHHPAVKKGRHVALIEDPLFFGEKKQKITFHKHKLVLHHSTMKMYSRMLNSKRIKVIYIDYSPLRSSEDMLKDLARKGYDQLHVADPEDHRLMKRIKGVAKELKINLQQYESPLFLSPKDFLDEFFSQEKTYLMARFYQAQRKRMNILMERGRPRGGRWSYDEENRKKLPRNISIPEIPRVKKTAHVKEAARYVNERFPDNPGTTGSFWYPSTHQEAASWLNDFLENRLSLFGDYEDALSSRHKVLFHSVLTPVLNIGLLTPEQVIHATLDFSERNTVPLNSLEGFIRQIIGWREFIRAMYIRFGEKQRKGNFWNYHKPMPDSFYSGTTGIEPVDTVIRRVVDRSYGHHIERLMVLGNFMLLCGISPREVYRWFMELFIDSYDWVMVPNVYGMSQFADGGMFATKPYISGAHYILKMSDFKKGPWCDIWNSLFWNFISTHRSFFEKQPRLSVMVRQLDRQGKKTLKDHRKRAASYLEQLFK